jgi:hypothetical protein
LGVGVWAACGHEGSRGRNGATRKIPLLLAILLAVVH